MTIPVISEYLHELLSFLVRHEFSEFIESRRNIMDSFLGKTRLESEIVNLDFMFF